MFEKCRGQHPNCDICDGIRYDPNTGWGGFTDHFAKKEFSTDEEQEEYYRQARQQGKSGERKKWDEDNEED